MKFYTGWQYLLIDAATQFGLDKLTFEKRIEWSTENLHILEDLADQAETKPLFIKAVMAIRKAQAGRSTGHMVGLDATCSGVQIMSCLTGCVAGARATGLIDPNVRADAYSATTVRMNEILGGGVNVSRKDAKQALMTSYYGSKATPKDIFGEGTKELDAFYQAASEIAPGAWNLLQVLLASWQPGALMHAWKMPDGFDVRVKVMQKVELRIEVDELDHASFTYEYYENQGSKKGLSNVANVTHSVDAWVLRSMHRRCNYNQEMAYDAHQYILDELSARLDGRPAMQCPAENRLAYYIEQFRRSSVADIVILPHLTYANVCYLSTEHLNKLAGILEGMLQYKPFELVTVHDEFKAHPNNLNWVRWQYRQILAEIADSNLLDDILSQLYGYPDTYDKLSFNLPEQIKQSAYALC